MTAQNRSEWSGDPSTQFNFSTMALRYVNFVFTVGIIRFGYIKCLDTERSANLSEIWTKVYVRNAYSMRQCFCRVWAAICANKIRARVNLNYVARRYYLQTLSMKAHKNQYVIH